MSRRALASTLLAVAALSLMLAALSAQLTDGFTRWTFEALRRDAADAGHLLAPAVPLRTAHGETTTPWPNNAGTVYLVDFIYTQCPTICQALGSEYTRLQHQLRERFGAHSPVRLVSVAFDREHDTPIELQHYAQRHRADDALWLIGTPASAAAADTLLQALGVVAVPDGLGGFVHNGAIHLIDSQGTVRGIYDLDQWPQALERALQLGGAPA
ncbi:MAG: SCO family protein [Zoogloeaceae bacterium]|uniref:SCO family protein n=1 Tax=Denitromonas sp. TaxID=2734609 RepID=UPI001DC5E212|nr:SCO family protein [Rhodocyclaceae bacterium]MCP5222582.1 SCO family protein [Zoogloeaceae bacterium]